MKDVARRADGEDKFKSDGIRLDDGVFKQWEEQTGKVNDIEKEFEDMKAELGVVVRRV